jgi:hypothetical protein
LIYFSIEWNNYIVLKELKIGMVEEMGYIGFTPCKKIIYTSHTLTLSEQTLAKIRA